MYLILIAFITALTLLLPWITPRLAKHFHHTLRAAPIWLPILAAVLYLSAPLLPDIHISHETNTFQEHFVGGGLYTTVLFVYLTRLLGWRPHWLLTFVTLFAWTASLGTLNELLEFTLVKLDVTQINITDTSWDLTANTVGMLTGFIIWRVAVLLKVRAAE